MGYGMATHLVRSGYHVTGYDVYEPIMAKFIKENRSAGDVRSDQTPAGAVKDAEVFIIMVANSVQATPLLFDPDTGAVQALGQGAIIMMCSTVAPAYISEVKARLKEVDRADVKLIDCPVSGGSIRAAEGKLSIFSSGSGPDLLRAQGILDCMSARLYKIPGGLGGGSKAKLIHQIFAGVNIAMFSEAMSLAAVAGFDTKHVYETLKESEASSWMFEQRVPYLLREKQGPYSAVTIIAKDVVSGASIHVHQRFMCLKFLFLYSYERS